MIRFRQDIEKTEKENLAVFATHAGESRGRDYKEKESETRTCFQRDVDRIAHSKAFRRLEYKTQVFVNYVGDHYRTRLTHTLEVALVAKSMARSLGVNTDLVEAIAYAHDLGHTPFGHAGEETLNELTQDIGGFEHNRQSLRIVEMLEQKYTGFPGLNLTWEVREGLIKHTSVYDNPDISSFDPDKNVSLEGQIVNLADELAYNCHDLEDGLRAGIIQINDLKKVSIWEMARCSIQIKNLDEDYLIMEAVRVIKGYLVRKALEASDCAIKKLNPKSAQDIANCSEMLICFDSETQRMIRELSDFLLDKFYYNHRIIRMTTKARWFLRDLFERYMNTPELLPEKIQHLADKNENKKRVICDYIAGMTDRFALDEYRKLTDPAVRV
jgi:dGTPase